MRQGEEAVMPEELRVQPAVLHVAGGRMEAAGMGFAAGALPHHDEFFEALARWTGPASREALAAAAARWQERHADHLRRAAGTSQHVFDAALTYSAQDADATQVVGAVLDAIVDAGKDTAADR